MTLIERLKLRTGSDNEAELEDCLESAKTAILNRRFPFGEWPTRVVTVDNGDGTYMTTEETFVEDRYQDLWFRIAMDIFNHKAAEGELSHVENGTSRVYEGAWISPQLLREIVPMCGVTE